MNGIIDSGRTHDHPSDLRAFLSIGFFLQGDHVANDDHVEFQEHSQQRLFDTGLKDLACHWEIHGGEKEAGFVA
jgi:hypothetical protein